MKAIFHKLQLRFDEKTKDSQNQMLAFGIFGIINYLGFYFVWSYFIGSGYDNLFLRIIAAILCLLLILKKYWPKNLKPFVSFYWYGTLLYCLPFFGTFMFLQNAGSSSWETNGMLVFFLLILLVDSASFLILLALGWALGCLAYYLVAGAAYIPLSQHGLTFFNYAGAIIIGLIFAHNKEKLQKEKLSAASAVGASIAHELRTPIDAFESSFNGIKRFLPAFMHGYQLAKNAGLEVEEIRPDYYKTLENILAEAEGEVLYSHTIIDMLLMNVQQKKSFAEHPMTLCSITDCINTALQRYPFASAKHAARVHWKKEEDFQFKGNEVLLTHVLFNLIKNAIHFTGKVKNAGIYLSIKTGKRYNYLYVKDTGKGVPKNLLPKLFTRFFTTTTNGTGLGLAFCKMVMEGFGGEITCDSKESEYTQFTLSFPKLPQT
ncbi:MAG: sensor histidine kinase [Gammaproteobacteria bacterium]